MPAQGGFLGEGSEKAQWTFRTQGRGGRRYFLAAS